MLEITVSLNPGDMDCAKAAIFNHGPKKDSALSPGADAGEFWQRAEERNRNTSDQYNQLGLPKYYAMEGFVRWSGQAV